MIELFSNTFKQLRYKEYLGKNDSGQGIYGEETLIKGLRLKGQYRLNNDGDGDTTTANIEYKIDRPIPVGSKLENREVVDCYPINGLWLAEGMCGYKVIVK